MGLWNCNGLSSSTAAGDLLHYMSLADILLFTETHETVTSPLPTIHDHTWISAFRPMLRGDHLRGSGGVACLLPHTLSHLVTFIRRDDYGRYLWLRLLSSTAGLDRDIFVAVCYFAPSTSPFADLGGDAFQDLSLDIARFITQGHILLAGDFNARTAFGQPFLQHDSQFQRSSQDAATTITAHGHRLLQIADSHGLVILNGLSQWPSSGNFTCHPYFGGHSVVDYFISSPALIPFIGDFHIHPTVLSDHSILTLSFSFPSVLHHSTPAHDCIPDRSYFPRIPPH